MKDWLLGMLVAGVFVAPATAQNWPGWRGPSGDGIVHETGFPTSWSDKDIAWKTPIPGKGHSSPIVWGDRVFVTSCIEGDNPKDKAAPRERILVCVDRRKGSIIWQKTVVTAKLESCHNENSYASSTPATDGKLVFVTFLDDPKVVVAAYDFDGNRVWRKSPGEFQSQHGFCSPPILYKDLVIVNCDQDGFKQSKPAYIVALDKETGEEKWRIDRPNRIRSYTPPFIAEAAGKMQMVLTGCKTVASYDPDTGKQIWLINGPTEQFVASMIFHKGYFYLTAGFPTYHVMCIKPDGTGNVTKTGIVWHETKCAGYVPSPVAHGDNIFLVKDDGLASCRDALTGEEKWLERLGRHHHSSPVQADGNLYFIDDDGICYVVKASPAFQVVAKNPLGEACFSSPAFSRGQIFVRGAKHLVARAKRIGIEET
jgi:outer membrane protein assembly factor BamB